MIYELKNGRIVGRYMQPQEGKDLLDADHPDVILAIAAESAAEQEKLAQSEAYQYARGRMAEYIAEFSKAPDKNAIDAIGHVLDAILSDKEGDSTALLDILAKRAEIKARHPK